MHSTDIVTHSTVREIVACLNREKTNVRVAIGMLMASQSELDARFKLGGTTGVSIHLNRNRYSGIDVESIDLEFTLKQMDKDAWKFIIDRADIWRILSEARAKELRGRIDNGLLGEPTEESVFELVYSYVNAKSAEEHIDEYAREVFEWIRPRIAEDGVGYNGAQFKTNKHDVIGPKIIRELMIDQYDAAFGKFRVRYDDAQQRLQVLENLFRALDGKGATGKSHRSELENAINSSKDGTGQTEYFKFRACKKGTLHIEFLRLDLLVELNRRAGGKNLQRGKS